ncbi:hypothetical protein WR25_24107 [Diploscapter pachys]|uniref:F-box domain-containing protein n=1 Tax=Diploscapter pachys TaxID=2018661 RepID=A0A2A2J4I4_9BILA|nr:hypothetical protein WR25_24107 [Diploscapter pachys]
MLANLPVEIILLICEYPEFKDLGQLAWSNNRMMRIIKRYLPIALERKTLFYRPDPPEWRRYASVAYFKDKLYYLGGYTKRVNLFVDGIVIRYIDYQTMNGNGLNYPNIFKSCLCFDPSAPDGSRVSRIADMNYARCFHPLIVANGKLYAIGGSQDCNRTTFCDSIEEYDPQTNKWRVVGETLQKMLFYRPDPPEWRRYASAAYFKDKLYYLGGWDSRTRKDTNQVDLLMEMTVGRYIDYQTMNGNGLKLESFQKNESLSESYR